MFGRTNFILAIFNMIPWPPLDGSHILANFNHGYARFMDKLEMTGGTLMGFVVIFWLAGRAIRPAADRLTEIVLTAARGF